MKSESNAGIGNEGKVTLKEGIFGPRSPWQEGRGLGKVPREPEVQ